MIEKVFYEKKMLALIVRGKYRSKKGVTFFTPNDSTQQFGYIKHKNKHIIKPHLHNKRMTQILYTSEVILILKGILRVDFYTKREVYLFSKIIKKNDIIILNSGGHGFKVLEPVEMIEVKQGPYNIKSDKKVFDAIGDNLINLK